MSMQCKQSIMAGKKNLVYYTVGGRPEYMEVLRASIDSVRLLGGDSEGEHGFDIMVMCDEAYAPNLSGLAIDHVHVTPANATHVHASMRKTEIFRFAGIEKYDRVLFLDCDIIVGRPLGTVFSTLQRDDVLYVKPEATDPLAHNQVFWACLDRLHSEETLKQFAAEQIYTLNAGQFAFRVGPAMRAHFEAVAADTVSYNAKYHFFEQSFMNHHFNLARAVDYALGPHVRLFAQEAPAASPVAINHFCGAGYSSQQKAAWMRSYLNSIVFGHA